jgi:hypothetical protein
MKGKWAEVPLQNGPLCHVRGQYSLGYLHKDTTKESKGV